MNNLVQNAYNFINQRPEIRKFMIEFNENDSFMLSKSPYIGEIYKAVEDDTHSNASFGCMLQECRQQILDDIQQGQNLSKLAHQIGNIDNMDDANKNAINVGKIQGLEKCIEYMFTEPESGKPMKPMSYGEMRMRYG